MKPFRRTYRLASLALAAMRSDRLLLLVALTASLLVPRVALAYTSMSTACSAWMKDTFWTESQGHQAGMTYELSPNEINAYANSCGLKTRVDYRSVSSKPPIVVSVLRKRIPDSVRCSFLEVAARLWDGATIVATKHSAGVWSNGECRASVTFAPAELRNKNYVVQSRALYQSNAGGSVMNAPFTVRSTFTAGKWTFPASTTTKSSIGVSKWIVWFTPEGSDLSEFSRVGGESALGGQPLDNVVEYSAKWDGSRQRWSVPAYNTYFRNEDMRKAIVIQGFDASNQSVGYVAIRHDSYFSTPDDPYRGTPQTTIEWKAGAQSGAVAALLGIGTYNNQLTTNTTFQTWAARLEQDLGSSGIVAGLSCDILHVTAAAATFACLRDPDPASALALCLGAAAAVIGAGRCESDGRPCSTAHDREESWTQCWGLICEARTLDPNEVRTMCFSSTGGWAANCVNQTCNGTKPKRNSCFEVWGERREIACPSYECDYEDSGDVCFPDNYPGCSPPPGVLTQYRGWTTDCPLP